MCKSGTNNEFIERCDIHQVLNFVCAVIFWSGLKYQLGACYSFKRVFSSLKLHILLKIPSSKIELAFLKLTPNIITQLYNNVKFIEYK